MQSITVRLIGKPGCHLCDEADVVVSGVVEKFSNVVLEHANLHDNTDWVSAYSEKIPVIQIDNEDFAHWRVRDDELMEALRSKGALLDSRESE